MQVFCLRVVWQMEEQDAAISTEVKSKTSTITIVVNPLFTDMQMKHVIDLDGIEYGWSDKASTVYDQYDHHNVTFQYVCDSGGYSIVGIVEDFSRPQFCCSYQPHNKTCGC